MTTMAAQWRHNGYNRYPIYDQNGWKTIPFGAAHTYIVHIREYPPGSRVTTHKGAFSSLFNLPWDLPPKYLTGLIFCYWGWNIPMKSLLHMQELCSSSVLLGHHPGGKPLVCKTVGESLRYAGYVTLKWFGYKSKPSINSVVMLSMY